MTKLVNADIPQAFNTSSLLILDELGQDNERIKHLAKCACGLNHHTAV